MEKEYDIPKIKKLFHRFLKEKKITKSFTSAFKKGRGEYFINDSYFNKPYSLISCYFLWDSTKEGSRYWGMLNDDWRKVLRKNDIEYQSIISI